MFETPIAKSGSAEPDSDPQQNMVSDEQLIAMFVERAPWVKGCICRAMEVCCSN